MYKLFPVEYYCEDCDKNITEGVYVEDADEFPEEERENFKDHLLNQHWWRDHVFCQNCGRQIKYGEPAKPLCVNGEMKHLCEECEQKVEKRF